MSPANSPQNYAVSSFYAAPSDNSDGAKKVVEVEAHGELSFSAYASEEPFAELRRLTSENSTNDDILERIFASGLRGCGGSHIPLRRKWEAALPYRPEYLVVNGLEGEPFTFKDYFLMRHYPQVLLEGIAITCRMLEIRKVYLVLNSAYASCYEALMAVIDENQSLLEGIDIKLIYGPKVDLYVVGEETALLNYIEGQRGEPRLKPPFPHEKGLWQRPTIINNVETLSWIPLILNSPERFEQQHPKLVTILGDAKHPGIYEVNIGESLQDIIEQSQPEGLSFIEVGGISGGLIPAGSIAIPYDDDALAELGVSVGSGTIRLFDSGHSPLDEMRRSIDYFRDESCGRCTPCRVGTQELAKFAASLDDVDQNSEAPEGIEWFQSVSETMQNSSTCGLGRAAPIPLLTYLKHFGKSVR